MKLVLMGLFSSDYQDRMFVPFVQTFLDGPVNPYDVYYENHRLASFPYPPLMLIVESVGGMLLQVCSPKSIFWRNLLFKLPLLAFDILGLAVLRKLSKGRIKYILALYFLSPINLYATYMHGQLDLIPTVLLMVAIHFLIQKASGRNLLLFSVFLGMSLASKLHILAALPILFMYLYKKQGWKDAVIAGVVAAGTFAAFAVPFWGYGLIKTVFFNQEQTVLTRVFFDYGTTRLIIPILVVLLVYIKVFQLQYINSQLLLSILGVLFVVFLVCVPPMPGWFVWVIPFIAIYFKTANENRYKMLAIYLLLNLAYLLYFIFFHQTEFVDLYLLQYSMQRLKIASEPLKYIIFTGVVACLVALVVEMYRSGVSSNSLYKRRNQPFTIGIAGDSGTGKSELLKLIEDLLGGSKYIQYIEGDGDHRWQRGCQEWEKYTHLDPKANYLYRQAQDIIALREGNMVRRVDYDHSTGIFTKLKRIDPKQYIVLCGLHSLYLPQTRNALDLKIYMDTDEMLRRFWKIRRDTGKRGYSNQEIIRQIEKRIPDAIKYIYPQKEFADLSVRYFDSTMTDCCDLAHEVKMSMELLIGISVDVEPIVSSLIGMGVSVNHVYCEDMKHQKLTFDGATLGGQAVDFQMIAEMNIPQFIELFPHTIHWEKRISGLLQLFILVIICAKMRGDA